MPTLEHFVLASSRSVYGEGGYKDARGLISTGLPRQSSDMQNGNFDVSMPAGFEPPFEVVPSSSLLPVRPASVYASTKLMQEYLVCQMAEGRDWTPVILRFQNVYGAGQSPNNPYTGVLAIFAQQLRAGNRVGIYEDGAISRDFINVRDVVEALYLCNFLDQNVGQAIDIGSGLQTTVFDAASILAQRPCRRIQIWSPSQAASVPAISDTHWRISSWQKIRSDGRPQFLLKKASLN